MADKVQGQWSPIAGTVLAAVGSLYLLWSTGGDDFPEEKAIAQYPNSDSSRRSRSSERCSSQGLRPARAHTPNQDSAGDALGICSESPSGIGLNPTITRSGPDHDHQNDSSQGSQAGPPTAGRHRVRKLLTAAGNKLGDAAHEKLDPDHDRKDNETNKFPEVPGEMFRNPDLEQISRTFSRLREERASSTYSASIMSTPGIESPPATHDSPRPDTSLALLPKRRATLKVPKEVHRKSESH
jgi:hypothetical protein